MTEKSVVNCEVSAFEITHKGHKYRIYRPEGSKYWIIRLKHKKRDYKKRLSPFRDIAIQNAKAWLDALLAERWSDIEAMRMRSEYSSIEQIIKHYSDAQEALEIDLRTSKENSAALCLIVQTALGVSEKQAKQQRSNILTEKLLVDHQIKALEAGLSPITISGRIIKARSIFSRRALPFYADLKLPDLSGFMKQAKLRRRTTEQTWQPFDQDTIKAMEDAAIALKESNRGLYRCYLLAARLGMRNSEILAARMSWLERRNNELVMAIVDRPEQKFDTKTGFYRWLPLSDELREEFGDESQPVDAYLVGQDLSDNRRKELVYREANKWIRKFIPDREKGLYELRKWAGSRVATETGNIYKAKEFLGHTTVLTTERHYAKLLDAQHKLSSPILSSTH